MKLRHLFTWFAAIFALALAITACSGSDDAPDTVENHVPGELAGTWDFADFTLTIDQQERGFVEYTRGGSFTVNGTRASASTLYEVFTYAYNSTRRLLVCTCASGKSFTLSNVGLDGDGKLTVTYGASGAEKTRSGTRHVYTALERGRFMGKWYLEGNEYFNFTATGVVLHGDGLNAGTWRTDGYSVWITIGDAETEYLRNVNMQGNVMKALVCDGKGYWLPVTLKQTDTGGNTDGGGGESKETIDEGSTDDNNKPDSKDDTYWGE